MFNEKEEIKKAIAKLQKEEDDRQKKVNEIDKKSRQLADEYQKASKALRDERDKLVYSDDYYARKDEMRELKSKLRILELTKPVITYTKGLLSINGQDYAIKPTRVEKLYVDKITKRDVVIEYKPTSTSRLVTVNVELPNNEEAVATKQEIRELLFGKE